MRPLAPRHQISTSTSVASLQQLQHQPGAATDAAAGNQQQPEEGEEEAEQEDEDEDEDALLDPATTCEMKRLWVDTAHQKSGLGKVLVAAVCALARQLGYSRMVLDTLESLTAANRWAAAANRWCSC